MTDSSSVNHLTLINKYIENDEKEKAVDLLYKLALQSAKNKDFINAETYRDRLYEVDSMALTRILEVNEVIESENIEGSQQVPHSAVALPGHVVLLLPH